MRKFVVYSVKLWAPLDQLLDMLYGYLHTSLVIFNISYESVNSDSSFSMLD